MILFLGGDSRQIYAAEYLKAKGLHAESYRNVELTEVFNKELKNASIIVLPLPISRDGKAINGEMVLISDLLSAMSKETLVIGGGISGRLETLFHECNVDYIDLLDIEAFQIQNALLSAEGAIYYAKDKLERTIHGAEIAILGFGRIGKILAYLLHSQGAKITVCARRDTDYVWSRIIGFKGLKIKKTGIRGMKNKYDIIFNTIPNQIMDEKFAKKIGEDTIIIDLASSPYGIDDELVKKYNLNYRHELSIPGRYAPKSAGEIMGKTIMNIITARRMDA